MVTFLTGKIDGAAINFKNVEGDMWQATIPPSLNGAYIVELTAVDEAGNIAYVAEYIVVVDLSTMHVSLQLSPYFSEKMNDKYERNFKVSDFYAEFSERRYEKRFDLSNYYAKIVGGNNDFGNECGRNAPCKIEDTFLQRTGF